MAIETPYRFKSEEQVNQMVNGNFDIWQRGTSAVTVGILNTYRPDRFYAYNNTGGTVTIGQSLDVPTFAQSGVFSQASCELAVTATGTPSNSQRTFFAQAVEGQFFQAMVGKIVTLSFWNKSHVTGVFPVSLVGVNSGVARSYVSTYTVTAANTWTKYTVSFNISEPSTSFARDNSVGAYLVFGLATGSDWQTTTPNTWVAGDKETVSGAANAMGTTGSVKFAQIMLNIGPAAAGFQLHAVTGDQEFRCCQRYFQTQYQMAATVNNTNVIALWLKMPIPMVKAPAVGITGPINFQGTNAINSNTSSFTPVTITPESIYLTANISTNGLAQGASMMAGLPANNGNYFTLDSDY